MPIEAWQIPNNCNKMSVFSVIVVKHIIQNLSDEHVLYAAYRCTLLLQKVNY